MVNLKFENSYNYNELKKKGILKEIKNPKIYFKYLFSLMNNKIEYYFKEENIEEIINELIVIEICKILDIDVVEQTVSSFECDGNLHYGLFSKSFKEKDYRYIFMEDILNDYYVYITNNDYEGNYQWLMHFELNNLEIIWQTLEYRYKDYPDYEKQIESFMNKLVDVFLLDILTGQIDRHGYNLEIKENDTNFSLVKLYDNALSFKYTQLSLGVSCDSFDYKNNNFILLINDFLNISSYEYILKFKNMLDILTINKFSEIVNDIKDKNNFNIETYYKDLITMYTEHYNEYTKILKKRLR